MEAAGEEADVDDRLQRLRGAVLRVVARTPIEQIARGSGIEEADLQRLLSGGASDLFVVAKLEAYFDVPLWPAKQTGASYVEPMPAGLGDAATRDGWRTR